MDCVLGFFRNKFFSHSLENVNQRDQLSLSNERFELQYVEQQPQPQPQPQPQLQPHEEVQRKAEDDFYRFWFAEDEQPQQPPTQQQVQEQERNEEVDFLQILFEDPAEEERKNQELGFLQILLDEANVDEVPQLNLVINHNNNNNNNIINNNNINNVNANQDEDELGLFDLFNPNPQQSTPKAETKAPVVEVKAKPPPPPLFLNGQLAIDYKLLTVDRDHLQQRPAELYQQLSNLDGIQFSDLIALFGSTKITKEDLNLWHSYSNTPMWSSESQLKSPLETIVTYCNGEAGAEIKSKMKAVIQVLMDQKGNAEFNSAGVLILLAAHGGMCHVQKEIGIRMAYSFVTNNLKVDMERESLKSYLLRLLYGLREVLCEKVFIKSKNIHNYSMNSHYIIPFRNGMAAEVGLDSIPDPNFPTPLKYPSQVPHFFEEYTTEFIFKQVKAALNEKPRKIPYDVQLAWLQQNRPKEDFPDAYAWLEEVFDEETGVVKDEYILFMLVKNEVLMMPSTTN